MVKSLNKAYKDKTIFYMCNACGEINNPNAEAGDTTIYKPEDVMTAREQILYEKYWSETGFMYVLRINNDAAICLSFLCDRQWCADIVAKKCKEKCDSDSPGQKWMQRLFAAITDVTEVFIQKEVPECDIYIGDHTDPDGHEILVVIPFEMRAQVNDIAAKLDAMIYEKIEEAF